MNHGHDILDDGTYDFDAAARRIKKLRSTVEEPELTDDLKIEEPKVRALALPAKAPKDLPKPEVDNSEAKAALNALRRGKPIQGDEGKED